MKERIARGPLCAAALFGLALAIPGRASAVPARKPAAHPAAAASGADGSLVKVTVAPEKVKLSGKGMSQRFLVFGEYADGRVRDLTSVAQISKGGTAGIKIEGHTVSALTNGDAELIATVGGHRGAMKITNQDVNVAPEWSFANEIVPIFTKSGCNSGGCHGSPAGRGGFRLSLFGYEPDYDYDNIIKAKGGARVDLNNPANSLILQKPTMKVPHGGGMRFKTDSEFYTRMVEWLKAGAPKQPEFDPRLSHIEIYPKEWTLDKPKETQQILVQAVRDDGSTQDVTQYARFTSNDDQVMDVDDDGVMTSGNPGETSIMIRYLGGVGIVRVKVPRPAIEASEYSNFKAANYIDELTLAKFKEVRIPPSDLASDPEFMRRAFIDTCGLTPTPEEARAFLDDRDPGKREKLIDSLLNRPEFIDYWTLKWSDLLRNNQTVKQDKGLQIFYRWIYDSIRDNKPYDEFAKELLLSSGSSFKVPEVNWYNTGDFGAEYPLFMASATSQVFLGVRIDCARCHNHPFESWSQMDYYSFAAFFARTKMKNGPGDQERIFFASPTGEVMHPRKADVVVPAKFLGGDVATFQSEEDRRAQLVRWITSPSNPWFKRSIANRIWNNFFGRGLVAPVDDYRLTNPASNEKLLDVLGEKVVEYKFNLKALMRDILMSRTYQTSSLPKKLNVDDHLYASHSLPRKMFAEITLDAIERATMGYRGFGPYHSAVSIADNRVGDGTGFLELFGRAKREQACECERSEETNVTMVLDLLNGDGVNSRISQPGGRVDRAVKANKPAKDLIEEFYLATLARRPNDTEQAAAQKLITKAPSVREGAEDLMWGLLNTKEFLFNH